MALIARHVRGPQGSHVIVFVRLRVGERLRTTAFRGSEVAVAGNFFRWDNPEELFEEKRFLKWLAVQVEAVANDPECTGWTLVLTYSHDRYVGWDIAAPVYRYHYEDLELYYPTHKSYALRVKPERQELLAPATNLVTLEIEFSKKVRRSGQVRIEVMIKDIRPGADIGEYEGDITLREGLVLFRSDHPGE